MNMDDLMYETLSDLASLDLSDQNLRDHPGAYVALENLIAIACGEAQDVEREACAKLCEYRTSSAVIAAGPRDRFGLAPIAQVDDRKHEGTKYAAAIRARGELAKDETHEHQ